MSPPGKVIGSISGTLNTDEFEWRINNCSEKIFEVKTGSCLRSPKFSFSSCSWCIEIYPNGFTSSSAEFISLYLTREKSDTEKIVLFSCAMSLHGIELVRRESTNFFHRDNEWGWPKYISRKEVLDHQSKDTKSCSVLTIKIRLRDQVFHDEDALLKVRKKETEILRQDYKDLLFHSEDRDLVLKVKDKEFRVHRNIMQFRCPVFKSMLSHEMLEKNSGVVEIPDCDPLAFEQFLLYIFTGEFEVLLDESTILGLYFIADKYDMKNLKAECSALIKESLSAHVVCNVIQLAVNHSDSELLEFATKYFVDNSKEIFVTVGWQTYMKENPTQANELIIKAFDKCSQCCVRSLKKKNDLEDFLRSLGDISTD